MSIHTKPILQWAGGFLSVVGIVFVLMRMLSYWGEINVATLDWAKWTCGAILTFVFGMSNLMLALAWRNLLLHFCVTVSIRWAVRAYGISQIAKYIPGNIFHLVGRQAMGAAGGLPPWPIAQSALWELGLMATTGVIVGLLATPLLTESVSTEMGLAFFLLALIVATALLRWMFSTAMIMALFWYVLFLLLSGVLFVIVVVLSTNSESIGIAGWLPIVGAYVLAWLAGLVTPGAPAGLGVREFVLLMLLQEGYSEAELLLAIALGRLVTTVGDIIFFLTAAGFMARHYNPIIEFAPFCPRVRLVVNSRDGSSSIRIKSSR